MIAWLRGSEKKPNFWEVLPTITAPGLLNAGEESNEYAKSELTAKQIPGAVFVGMVEPDRLYVQGVITMNKDIYPFQVGDFECYAINDGGFVYENPASIFFTNAPRDQLAKVLQSHSIAIDQWKEYLSPFTCLGIKTHKGWIVTDTGIGVDVTPSTGKLLDHLAEVGVTPDQIGIVILTHGHGDHIGGNTGPNGQRNFPNARFFMAKAEWDHWTAEKTMAEDAWGANMVRKNLIAIADQFTLIEEDCEISPGIEVIQAPGHLPGHLIVSAKSGAEQLLFTSDTFIHPIHIEHPEWYTEFETYGEKAVATRTQILEKASQEKALVLSFHFPFPGLGYIIKKNAQFKWLPFEIR